MSTKRRLRVADAIQEALAEILRRVKDPRVGMAAVTAVELSPDLRHARVRISVIGDEAEQQRTMEGLERAKGFIRSELGRAVRLRHVPELDFRLDQSAAYSVRVAQLLREIRARDGAAGGDSRSAAGGDLAGGAGAGEDVDGAAVPGEAAGAGGQDAAAGGDDAARQDGPGAREGRDRHG